MRRFLSGCCLLITGAVSLIGVVAMAPLVAAMHNDRAAKQHRDEHDRERWLGSDDSGVDVDGAP